ncbi:hypothetical protein C0058_32035 [Pseudomonas sp. NC02]|nr:hypothetical protein C0058_32035 [Pseudomonas sp. NC02]
MARELAPVELRSGSILGAATRPNGSKLPRHRFCLTTITDCFHEIAPTSSQAPDLLAFLLPVSFFINAGLSSNCHIPDIECSHGLPILGPDPTIPIC